MELRPSADPAPHVELVLSQLHALPTLSSIATRLLSLSADDESDIREIVGVIESDPPMTARIISLCRSAATGLGNQITSLERAVVMLGLDVVRNAALSVEIYNLFRPNPQAPAVKSGESRFDAVGFWQHSIAVAVTSELIAHRLPRREGITADGAFVAGLLHDLGKLALERILPKSYDRVVELADRRQANIADVEREIIGLDHHTAGKRLAEQWGLPQFLHDVLWFHGQGAQALAELENAPIIALVTLADQVVRRQHIGFSGDHAMPGDLQSLARFVGLGMSDLDDLTGSLHEQVARRSHVLGLGDRPTTQLLCESIARANRALARSNHRLILQAQAARQAHRTLQATSEFIEAALRTTNVTEVCAQVAISAASFLGQGFYAVIHTTDSNNRWAISHFASDGRVLKSIPVNPSDLDIDPTSPHDQLQISTGMLNLLPVLADLSDHPTDLQQIRLLPLRNRAGLVAVVLHDTPAIADPATMQNADTLFRAWTAMIAAACKDRQSARLNERLVDSNRLLASTRDELAKAQSLATVGELAAGAAHEMNNPLCIISGRAQVLAKSLTQPTQRKMALQIVEESTRLSDLITSLHLFACPPEPQRSRVTIGDLIARAVTLASQRFGSQIKVNARVPGDLPGAYIDESHVTQALVEVLLNAAEAGPRSAINLKVLVESPDDRLIIEIDDDGIGMSPQTLMHAFDPFFSDKQAGRKCGLGLSRAKRLLQAGNGDIQLDSIPSKGTSVCIVLNDWQVKAENNSQPEAPASKSPKASAA